MKERPILFNSPMVSAILDGTKMQTRRAMERDPNKGMVFGCKYGKPGDRLWVKETWKPHCEGPISKEFPMGTCVKYRADGAMIKPTEWTNEQGAWCEARENDSKWRPAIFMPRWASRITLNIVEVRAQRLQDLSEKDARAEGVLPVPTVGDSPERWTAKRSYQDLWESINGKGSWALNPWVWAISFRRI